MNISILILTYDEEVNLPLCLASVSWSDDIVVFDSFSSDRTVEIAEAAGARVFQRSFDGYGSQREAARTMVDYKYDWLFVLDADECIDDQLREELVLIARSREHAPTAYRVRRKDHFMGRWIKRATLYPSWFVRLFRHKEVQYEPRAVHEYPVVKGVIGELGGHLLHYSFNKGFGEWFSKHVRYAQLEAEENVRHLASGSINWFEFISRDPVRRRRALKALSFRLPFRPFLRFAYMYFVRGGILDGIPGFHYCCMLAIYEYLIVLNIKERNLKGLGLQF